MNRMTRRMLMILGMMGMVVAASCTSYASKEELAQLDERRAKLKSMENEITTLTGDRKKAEQDVQQRRQKLDQAKKEKELVLQRLQEIEKANQGQ